MCSRGTWGNTLVRFMGDIGDSYVRIQLLLQKYAKCMKIQQLYRRGTGTNHGKLEDVVSDLRIKGERLGDGFSIWGPIPLLLWDQFQKITLEVNTKVLEGTNDWTK